jgi:hypothetical protein
MSEVGKTRLTLAGAGNMICKESQKTWGIK